MSALTSFGKTVSRNRNIVLAYVAMLVLLTAVSIYRPGFGWGDPLHLRALVLQAAVIGLASMGQTLVIISGGADLSLPWTLTGAAIMHDHADPGKKRLTGLGRSARAGRLHAGRPSQRHWGNRSGCGAHDHDPGDELYPARADRRNCAWAALARWVSTANRPNWC